MQTLYRCLLQLHPHHFRERFEEEMLLVFEDAVTNGDRLWLVGDAFASLLRQWILRPHRDLAKGDNRAVTAGATPMFSLIEQTRPRPSALLLGSMLSLTLLSSFVATSYFTSTYPHLGYAIVGIHWSWGWDLTGSRPLESQAGRRLQQWVDAYNSRDVAAMRQFTSQNVSHFFRYARTDIPNVEYWTSLFQQVGPFQLHSVRESEGGGIIGLAQVRNGDWWWIRLNANRDDPDRLWSVTTENLAEASTPPTDN